MAKPQKTPHSLMLMAALAHISMCSQAHKTHEVLSHPCSTPAKSPQAVGCNGWPCSHLNVPFCCGRWGLRMGQNRKRPSVSKRLWHTLACVPSLRGLMKHCHTLAQPLASLHKLWDAMAGLAPTSTCHSASAGGASGWAKTANARQSHRSRCTYWHVFPASESS